MLTTEDFIRAITPYPVPQRTVESVCAARGVGVSTPSEVLTECLRALLTADVLMWLALAPNVTQGGQSYSLTDAQRTALKTMAAAHYRKAGAEDEAAAALGADKINYGYKGSKL